jgi:hypothetical protein
MSNHTIFKTKGMVFAELGEDRPILGDRIVNGGDTVQKERDQFYLLTFGERVEVLQA